MARDASGIHAVFRQDLTWHPFRKWLTQASPVAQLQKDCARDRAMENVPLLGSTCVLDTTAAPVGEPTSVPALLERNARRMPERPAYREKEFGIWQSVTVRF